MKKASRPLVPVVLVALGAAIAQSCASGQPAPGSVGSGGDNGNGSGGSSGNGTGGNSTSSTGGRTSSGGSTVSSGGKTGSGGTSNSSGTTGSSTGGNTSSTGGKTSSGGTTGTSTGGTTISTGGATMTTGSGGTTGGACSGTNSSAMNGYINAAPWMGYAFTLKGGTATVTPDCSTPAMACYMTAATALCAMGSVGPDTTYNAVAGFGWNIGQAMAAPNPAMAVAPTGSGLAVNIPGANAMMRIQLSDGGTPETTWCADMPAGGTGTIPWTTFAKACYNNPKGAAFTTATKIAKVEVIVPSNAATAVPFCFCVVSIGPG